MKRGKRSIWVSILMVMVMALSIFGATASAQQQDTRELTFFSGFPNIELNKGNDIQQLIAEKTGYRVKETYLTGQSLGEAIGMMIASGEYPDLIVADTSTPQLIEAGALIPIDEYWDEFPTIKNFWADWQWEYLRQADGHIYAIPQGNVNITLTDTKVAEAFYVQTRVLKWAGYPEIETLDQLFDMLAGYYAKNPTMEDGSPVIPFGILSSYLDNPPLYLDGTMNNGTVIVDEKSFEVIDHNVTATARRYYQKLNESYHKGLIDPEFMTISKDQFLEKVASGRVLCMVEASWDFANAENSIKALGLDDCTYVPLGITIDEGIPEKYYIQNNTPILTTGLSITTNCKDVRGAMQFLSDLMTEELMALRNWGIAGTDYLIDENGIFYRTPEMRLQAKNPEYRASHFCPYSGLLGYVGMHLDGKNAANPDLQPSEFYESLLPQEQECLNAYNAKTFVELLDKNEPITLMEVPWFPMWTYSNMMTTDTPGGMAFVRMEDAKTRYLPRLVIADDFDAVWEEYLTAYNESHPERFIEEMQAEVYSRIEKMTGQNVRPAN